MTEQNSNEIFAGLVRDLPLFTIENYRAKCILCAEKMSTNKITVTADTVHKNVMIVRNSTKQYHS